MSDGPSVPEWSKGDRLRKARLYAHLEQDDLARALGVSRPLISKFEKDEREIRRAYATAWAVRCRVPFEWLWDGKAPKEGSTNLGRGVGPWHEEWFPQSA